MPEYEAALARPLSTLITEYPEFYDAE
jgi:hypothetical protein